MPVLESTKYAVHSEQDHVVLVAEDNEDLRSFLRESLSPSFRVLEAADGIMGLKKAQSSVPDLVISDIVMPGLDGIELCKKLKKDIRTSHIPVILLTARSTINDRIHGIEQGADDYISKPFSMEELLARIGNLLVQREKLKKKYAHMIGMDWSGIRVTTFDEVFLKKATAVITENLHRFDFNVGALQEKMSMSRGHLRRKLVALTGYSSVDLIRIMRLKAAESLLRDEGKSVTEVAMQTGFNNLSYFARAFKQYFGKSPRDYRNQTMGSAIRST